VSVTTGGDGAPLGLDVTAPGTTAIDVHAGPTTGIGLQVSTGVTPPVRVNIAPPAGAQLPLPSVGTDAPVAVTTPTVVAPAGTPTPAPVPAPGIAPVTAVPPPPLVGAKPSSGVATGNGASAHASPGVAIPHMTPAATPAPLVTRIPRSTSISASIESTSHPGFLSALSAIPASVMLWLALVGLAIAFQSFVRSAVVARRRHTAPVEPA